MENLIGGDHEIGTCVSSLTLILAFLPSFRTVLTSHFDWNNQGLPSRAKLFCALIQCYYSHSVVSLWLGFAKWRRQKLKRTLPICFLQVKGWGRGERGEGKKKRKKMRGRKTWKWKDLASQIVPIAFRSQFLQKALAVLPRSLSLAHCVLCSSSLLPLFFHFILRSHWGYYWWGTSCSMFSFSLRVLSLTTPRELWTNSRAFEDSLQPSWKRESFSCTQTNNWVFNKPPPL